MPLIVPLEREFRGSHYKMRNRATLITRVMTAEGVIGEAYAADEDSTLLQIANVVKEELEPKLIGENALSYERIWELGHEVTFDQLRDKKVGLVALAGVDFAIWDAIGKLLGVPLWQLWGGYRDRMPINIIGGYYGTDLDGIRDEVSEWLDMGFRGCKFKIGRDEPWEDARRVEAVREAAGDYFVITVDANQGYTLHEAIDVCERLKDLNIRWFEEPCIWTNDRRDMHQVRTRGGIPVCAGQSEYSPEACRDLMDAEAIDVCNFDASWSGGYTAWKRMAAAARLHSVQLAHHEEPQVATHLLGGHPNGTYVEVFHPSRDPIWWRMVTNRPTITDGEIRLPTAPGLGWELDNDFIEHYRVPA